MSDASTGELTEKALRRAGLSVVLAPELRDVDVAADADAVAQQAPRTEFARIWQLAVSPA